MSDIRPHVDDGVLVRILDGEPVQDDDARHAAGCPACAARLQELRRGRDQFSLSVIRSAEGEPSPPADLWERVLAATDRRRSGPGAAPHPPGETAGRDRRGSRYRPYLRAAAIVALVVAGALTAEPVRTWLVQSVERTVETLRPGASRSQVDPAVTVRVVPRVDTFEFRLDEAQTAGSLVVAFEERADALAEILTGDPDAEILVLPGAFQIRNAGRDWSYRLKLPVTLDGVRVRTGGEVIAEVDGRQGTTRIEFR